MNNCKTKSKQNFSLRNRKQVKFYLKIFGKQKKNHNLLWIIPNTLICFDETENRQSWILNHFVKQKGIRIFTNHWGRKSKQKELTFKSVIFSVLKDKFLSLSVYFTSFVKLYHFEKHGISWNKQFILQNKRIRFASILWDFWKQNSARNPSCTCFNRKSMYSV
jgi:hypothetical protein